jgi:hypothetical protein
MIAQAVECLGTSTVKYSNRMIRDDDELRLSIAGLNKNLQDIQDYIGRDEMSRYTLPEFKIRFPRFYIRTAAEFRNRLPFIQEENLKRNIAYSLIESDLQFWILTRTDIAGVLKGMVIKSTIIKVASIAEACVRHVTTSGLGNRNGFIARCERLHSENRVSEVLLAELNWLWETRSAIHLHLLGSAELDTYTTTDFVRAFNVGRQLLISLSR